jgi:hypothetical protein
MPENPRLEAHRAFVRVFPVDDLLESPTGVFEELRGRGSFGPCEAQMILARTTGQVGRLLDSGPSFHGAAMKMRGVRRACQGFLGGLWK